MADDDTFQANVYEAQGGDSYNVKTGGTLNINGTLNMNGVACKIARGEVTLSGSNPTSVLATATGLTNIIAAFAVMKGTAAPGLDPYVLTVNFAGSSGQLDIYAWKATSNSNPTLIASSNSSQVIEWVAIGS